MTRALRALKFMGMETGVGLSCALLVLAFVFLEGEGGSGATSRGWLTFFDDLESKLIDYRFRVRDSISGGKQPVPDEIVVVTIDSDSCREPRQGGFGKWPWRRSIVARGLKHLGAMEPGAVALDVLFAEGEFIEERETLRRLRDALTAAVQGQDPVSTGVQKAMEEVRHALPPDPDAGMGPLWASLEDLFTRVEQSGAGSRAALEDMGRQLDGILAEFEGDAAMVRAMGSSLDPAGREEGLYPILAYRIHRARQLQGEETRPMTQSFAKLLVEIGSYPVNLKQDCLSIGLALPEGDSVEWPPEQYAEAAAALGQVNVIRDADNGVRHDVIGWRFQGEIYPPLSFQAVRQWALNRGMDSFGRTARVDVTPQGRPFAQIGDVTIPLDHRGRFLINFLGGSGAFHQISFRDVYRADPTPVAAGTAPTEGQRSFETLRRRIGGKIILIGSTTTGAFDHFATPFSSLFPGVLRHATLVENLLHGRFLRQVGFLDEDALPWYLLGLLIAVTAVGVLAAHTRPVVPALAGAAILGSYVWVSLTQFARHDVALNMMVPLTTLSFSFTGILAWRVLHEERSKRFIKDMFGNYLSPQVVEALTKDPASFKLGGELREATIFFSDIRGFTSLSERMPPGQLVTLLNEYFREMGDAILENNGRIDKYIGDGIMAEFGVPVPQPDHAAAACRAALSQIGRLKTLNERFAARGWPRLEIRIGIHSGTVKAGNFGSDKALSYTVIGDNVNLSSRLEGANKEFGTAILASDATLHGAKEVIEARELDLIRVVGKNEPVRVFEVMALKGGLSPGQQAVLTHYRGGLKAFRERDWDGALAHFSAALQVDAGDGPSLTYVGRCKSYRLAPPPMDWDGVFTLGQK